MLSGIVAMRYRGDTRRPHITFKGDLSPHIWYEYVCPYMGVIGYHVTLSEGHMIANHPIYGGDWLSCPLRRSHDSQSPHIRKHLCPILLQL